MVAGNHDWAAAGTFNKRWFNPYAEKAVAWTESVLSDEDKEFLRSMKLTQEAENAVAVHGSLDAPQMFKYVYDIFEAEVCLGASLSHVCFIGHTHSPSVFYMMGNDVNYTLQTDIQIFDGTKYLVNVGSVGQPRDGNPYASYCVWDSYTRRIQIKRVRYDIPRAQEKILNAGLPHILADRLPQGR
jgi:diadenosine tetraphosphatase ApaH/serine/threonine PP2A family protein phosphatase